MVKHIAFTAYPVKDMARAQAFYEGGLGLKRTNDFEGKWVEYVLDNGCFAITTMMPVKPSVNSGGSIAFEVDDVDATVKTLLAAKATVVLPAFETPGCRMAVLADTEGNAFTLHAKHADRL